jgi:hypothetical protein
MSKRKVFLAAAVMALSIGAIAPAASSAPADVGALVEKSEHDTGDTAFRAGDNVGDVMVGAAQLLGGTLNPR